MNILFNKKNVKIVAEAVINNSLQCVDYIEDRFTHYQCVYCHEEFFTIKNFKHDINCPVLVAKDLLTRI